MTGKEIVLAAYPNAVASYSHETDWVIDDEVTYKALNWSDKTEQAAWERAAFCIQNGVDPAYCVA